MTTELKNENTQKNPVDLAKRVFDVEAQAILALKERLGEPFIKAVKLVSACQGKVVVTGVGKSGIIARKIAATMSSTGTAAVFLHPVEGAHGDIGMVGTNDLIIAISYGGETPELAAVLSFIQRKNLPLIAITGNIASDLAQRAAVALDVKVSREACPLGLAPTASSTATLAMGDALALAVSEVKGFRSEDFAQYHPGGGLGFKLSRIKDLMHTGSAMPILKVDTPFKQVLSVMSRGEVRGAAGVIDESGDLIGIITDGDIRRKLESAQDPLQGVASDLMIKNPRTIDANEVAEKALFLMEQFRINLLFVIDKSSNESRKPVGIIHIQDLVRAKVR